MSALEELFNELKKQKKSTKISVMCIRDEMSDELSGFLDPNNLDPVQFTRAIASMFVSYTELYKEYISFDELYTLFLNWVQYYTNIDDGTITRAGRIQ